VARQVAEVRVADGSRAVTLGEHEPVRGVELPAIPEPTEIRFLDLDEMDALVAAAQPVPSRRSTEPFNRTASMTGCAWAS
jgi:hypothetical protein